jgi:hypothetical protein
MRYSEGEIPPELLASNASNDMLLFTAMIGLAVGAVLFFLGRLGRQMWMWTWGGGLVFCSVYLWLSIKFDFRPFGAF